jgi:DivIVA protein
MSISERQAPDFSHALRGYDRAQVDEYLASYTEYSVQVEERARKAETALAQCRRELASAPGTVGISERLASILQLANEEAEEIRERARTESEATTRAAASEAERTVDDALRQRDAIQLEIDELTDVREALLQRLIALSGQIVDATERYQGYAPGMAPRPPAGVKLFDAEAIDDEAVDDEPPAAEPEEAAPAADADAVVDPEAVTQRITTTGPPPEHDELVE